MDKTGQPVLVIGVIFILYFIAAEAEPCQDSPGAVCQGRCDSKSYPIIRTDLIHAHCKKTCKICETSNQCGDGYYGDDCKPCVSRCQNGRCETTRPGECQKTCPDGYHGYKCDASCPRYCLACDRWNGNCTECEDGLYGVSCSENCPVNCEGEVCDQETGECHMGCKPTWKGNKCEEQEKICKNCARHDCGSDGVCTSGCKDNKWFGKKCEDKCSPNCRNKTCNKDNANCLLGCKNTFYGANCTLNCSDNCASRRCDEKTGKCKNCVTGRHGEDCSSLCHSNCKTSCYRYTDKCKDCKEGWFGRNCTKSCQNCKDGCDRKGNCNGSCVPGFYSSRCDRKCNEQCNNSVCHQTTGECSEGCKDTWHGADCSSKCSSNCVDSLCTVDSSDQLECLDGCVDGLKGKYCEETCPDHCITCNDHSCDACESGYHGISCEVSCPDNCEGGCQKEDGQCAACKPGYYGDKCQTPCNTGCKGRVCTKDDGSCRDGCIAGWKGAQCDELCPSNCQSCIESSCTHCKPGWYDLNNECNKTCSRFCHQGSCDSNGECQQGCVDGFFGPKCNQACRDPNCLKCNRNSGQCELCKPSWYGSSCGQECPNCAEGNCSRTSGECQEGCSPGFHGNKCNQPCASFCKPSSSSDSVYNVYCDQQTGECIDGCTDGHYGQTCKINCSETCKADVCNQTTGICSYGCRRGKYGDFCEETCSLQCGAGEDTYCHQTNGSCVGGCKIGFYGDYCSMSCSEGCLRGLCDQLTGHCSQGCKEGVTGGLCDTECPDHFFGFNCNSKCGHCKNNNTCDRFHGNCSGGCAQGFDGHLCFERLIIAESPAEENSTASLAIVLAVVAIVLVAVLCVVGFLIYRRRSISLRRRNDKDYLMVPMMSNVVANPSYSHSPAAPCKPLRTTPKKNGSVKDQNGHTAMADIHEDGEDDNMYYNTLPNKSTTVVRTSELWSYVQQMKRDGTFQDQYDSLPTGLIHSCKVAMLPENKGKNRYKNICAFDRSRVILDKEDGDPNSDYINANYITGYQQPKLYVASQGPVDVILVDFWRMIWQLNTSKIVMLTNIVEEGRMKCVVYWPELDSGPIQYGNMVVECTTEEVLAHYTVRTLKMCNIKQGRSKSSNTRIVKHFHFTSWPDKGVPTDVASLVEFYFKVMNTPTHNRGPMVVHCSAGIGRTGTFLALSYLIDEAKSGETVDPYQCIHRMRSERVNMVQTEEQYEFLHQALVEAIMVGGTTVPTANFNAAYEDLLQTNPTTGVQKLKEQFETLNLMTPLSRQEEYHTALLPENISKNRFKDILASDYHRPFLSTPVHGRNDYINAVFLPAYKQKRAFILTQMPMTDTVIDFWRLMFESYSQTIVMLNDDSDDQLTMGYYWPRHHQREMYGPFLVEIEEEEDYECYRVVTLRVTKPNSDTENDSERYIKIFQCAFWPQGQITPDSAAPLFAVMGAVEAWQMKTNQAQVTVHCLDGVERSGLFCVLFAILERLKIEQDVSILQTISQMRVCREQLIQSFSQFKFLYTAVQDYLETFSTYSNFT